MNGFDFLGVTPDQYKEIETKEPGEGQQVLDSGVYDAKVKEVAKYKNDKGGVQGKITVELPQYLGHEITKYVTFVKNDGTEIDWGKSELKQLLDSIGADPSELNVVEGETKAYGQNRKAAILKGIEGRPLKVAVRKVHQPGSNYEWFNEIEFFMRPDGTNAKGENVAERFLKKIEKTPVLERKPRNTTGSTTATVTTSSGTNVADLI